MNKIQIKKETTPDGTLYTVNYAIKKILSFKYQDITELMDLLTENKNYLKEKITLTIKTKKLKETVNELTIDKFKSFFDDEIIELNISMIMLEDGLLSSRTININNEVSNFNYFTIKDRDEMTTRGLSSKIEEFINDHTETKLTYLKTALNITSSILPLSFIFNSKWFIKSIYFTEGGKKNTITEYFKSKDFLNQIIGFIFGILLAGVVKILIK